MEHEDIDKMDVDHKEQIKPSTEDDIVAEDHDIVYMEIKSHLLEEDSVNDNNEKVEPKIITTVPDETPEDLEDMDDAHDDNNNEKVKPDNKDNQFPIDYVKD